MEEAKNLEELEEKKDAFDTNYTPVAKEPEFGLLFDIDGVLGRGHNPLPEAIEAFELLKGPDGELKVPVAFLTNACGKADTKAKQISSWFNCEITPSQIIHAPSPLLAFTPWHKKRILFVGQGPIIEIAHELGFVNVVTIDEIIDAYPLLDMADHANRKKVAAGYTTKGCNESLEGIILLGEPVRWESYLQVIIDLLVTNGKPDHAPTEFPENHLPILACNMDLVFMHEASMPRFGHGAFLICLENLYEKYTGHKLKYTALIGKPSEITYRYGEHTISVTARKMGYTGPMRKLYFFGDNPEVDILGANLYNNYLKRYRRLSGGREITKDELFVIRRQISVHSSRMIPEEADFFPQTARGIDSILVCTGVYKPCLSGKESNKPNYCHRDFLGAADLIIPNKTVDNCLIGIKDILKEEKYNPKSV